MAIAPPVGRVTCRRRAEPTCGWGQPRWGALPIASRGGLLQGVDRVGAQRLHDLLPDAARGGAGEYRPGTVVLDAERPRRGVDPDDPPGRRAAAAAVCDVDAA